MEADTKVWGNFPFGTPACFLEHVSGYFSSKTMGVPCALLSPASSRSVRGQVHAVAHHPDGAPWKGVAQTGSSFLDPQNLAISCWFPFDNPFKNKQTKTDTKVSLGKGPFCTYTDSLHGPVGVNFKGDPLVGIMILDQQLSRRLNINIQCHIGWLA